MITEIQKTKLNELIASTEGMVSRIQKGVVQGQEAGNYFRDAIFNTKALFESTSDEWRIIDRWVKENNFDWHLVYKSGSYAGDKEKQKLESLLRVLFNLLPSNLYASSKKELHFSETQAYEAKRYISSLFRSAGSKITIVDEHLDDQFFDYMDIISDDVEVRVITGDKKTIFWKLLHELNKKRKKIEARVNNISHSRYIVIDDSGVYSTDASLNTIGKKAIMIHKLEDDVELQKVKSEIEAYWTNAKSYIPPVLIH